VIHCCLSTDSNEAKHAQTLGRNSDRRGRCHRSRRLRDLAAGSGLIFDELGAHQLIGRPEDTPIYLAR
jgi:hypothetical protein